MTLFEKIERDSILSKEIIKKSHSHVSYKETCKICGDVIYVKPRMNTYIYDKILSHISSDICGECMVKYFSYRIDERNAILFDEDNALFFRLKSPDLYESFNVKFNVKIPRHYFSDKNNAIIEIYSFLFGN